MTPSDEDLIARTLVNDDRRAFGELVQRHQSSVRRFLRCLTGGDAATADDLAQETFLQAFRSLSHYRADSSFSTWLLGIANNYYRNERRRKRPAPQENLPDQPDENALSPARSTDLQQDLTAALGQLSSDEQTALHVCYHQGLSHVEAANLLGWPVGTLKTHVARSKEKLRQLLAAWNPQR